jgi:hypothetical protein
MDTLEPEADAPLPSEIWETNGGVYLGYTVKGRTDQRRPLRDQENAPSIGRHVPVRTTWETDGKINRSVAEGHIAMFGEQGNGKSRKLLMPNLFRLRDWSVVVMDTKGELTAHTAVWRARQGHKVYVVDPFNHIKNTYPKLYAKHPEIFKSHGYNPLAAIKADDMFSASAFALAKALISSEGTKEIHFPQGAQALAAGLIMGLRLDRPGVSDNLVSLRTMLTRPVKQLSHDIGKLIDQHGKKYPAIATNLNEFTTPQFLDKATKTLRREEFKSGDDRELHGVRRTGIFQSVWLDTATIQPDLRSANPIDFGSFKNSPQTVYFVLPAEHLADFGVWLRVMISSALRPMMRSVEDSKVPVLFMLDEAATLGNLEIMSKNLGQMRGFGLELWTVWQDISQLEPIYEKAWKNIMSLSQTKVTFSTAHDPDTGDYFSRLSGERLYKHTMASSSKNKTVTRTTGTNDGWSSSHGQNITGGASGGSSSGYSSSTSDTKSNNDVLQSERTVKTYELAKLNADEAVIFSRRGMIEKTICPQPNIIQGISNAMEQARADIEGRQVRPTVTVNDILRRTQIGVVEPTLNANAINPQNVGA